MASRDSLLNMLKNEYPSSYNSKDTDNMSVKELEDLLDFLDSTFKKKDGGLMIAIEQLGKGGITGGKTYHQYHDQFVPPDSESQMYANGGGVGSMMQPKKKNYKDQRLTAAEKKKIKPANQGVDQTI